MPDWFSFPVFYEGDEWLFAFWGASALLIAGSSLVAGYRVGLFLAFATGWMWLTEVGAVIGLVAGLVGGYSLFI